MAGLTTKKEQFKQCDNTDCVFYKKAILTRKERPYPPGLKKPPQVEYTFTPFPLSCSVCEEFVMADLYRKKE